ncbi:glycosyltransferase family 39 protein [Stieleria sp.]|uniref:glycosyltransferase family 39 protein n=1 Tax=Stieleria sp. TaxID=2795976 RepID=UPI00356792E5
MNAFRQHTETPRAGLALAKLIAIAVAFVLIVGYALARFHETTRHPLRVTQYPEQWIRAAGPASHAGYFRKRFDLPGHVKHAWIKLVATDAFEVSVNRNPHGRLFLWRPTRPFQTGTSEKGQVLSTHAPAMALNFPREYQWDGHETWRLPSYFELTSSLRPGKNVIAIEIESRRAPARVAFIGEIQLSSGQIIPIHSDPTWLAEPSIPGPQLLDWTEVYYWDQPWRNAVAAAAPRTEGYRSHPEEIYTRPFEARWMRHRSASSKAGVTFQTEWKIDGPVDEAYLRLLTNRGYELHINGTRVRVASVKPPDLDNGQWVFGRGSAHDPTTRPELLDPDEVGSSFIGTRFESPRTADKGLSEFRNPFSPQLTPFRYTRTYNRAQAPGVFEPRRTLAESRRTPETPDLFPETPRPNALKHDLAVGGYLSYSVANLLHQGTNRIEVRCLEHGQANWPVQIAVDGGVRTTDGNCSHLPDETQWRAMATEVVSETQDASQHQPAPVQRLGSTAVAGQPFPAMQYRGIALHPESFDRVLPKTLLRLACCVGLGIALILSVASAIELSRRAPADQATIEARDETPLWLSCSQMMYAMLLTFVVTIGAGLLLECSWTERHEVLWCIDGTLWTFLFPFAIGAAFFVAAADTIGRLGLTRLRARGHSLTARLRCLPDSKLWFHLIIWVLLLGAVARGYKLDLQPLDDDEYASTQAVLAILETGAPGFVPDDVYYTRSPFFHYVTAAIAWPFGGNLWSLRLQSVGWSVATAWLLYLCGSHLLDNRWAGFLGMLLLCLHPFEIFTGHVIRFYQMQQFFALLTMYCFCRGFVSDQSQRFRVITLIVFLVSVLSQEITVAMGPSLIFGYLVFAKDLGWSKNITLALISVAVVACIALDFVVFQTLCLTRTEGVSPSIEAAVKPHFWYPMNLLSIFIGYSRLHVVPSFFLLAGLPLQWRDQNRNTLALLAFLISGVVMTNVLVTNVSLRYMYWLFPVWILLCVDGMQRVLATLVSAVYPPQQNRNRYASTLAVCFTVCALVTLASWSPWRIPGSYELRILGDSTAAVRWVRSQKRPGDRLAITEPHTHCAFLEAGKCDYDIALPLLYDFAVMRDGVLVDRNGGGEVVSNLDQLIGEFSQGHRIWVLLNREKFRTRGKNMRWEYPGARFETFLRQNCELKYRTYLWSVYLWDPARGHFRPFRLQE